MIHKKISFVNLMEGLKDMCWLMSTIYCSRPIMQRLEQFQSYREGTWLGWGKVKVINQVQGHSQGHPMSLQGHSQGRIWKIILKVIRSHFKVTLNLIPRQATPSVTATCLVLSASSSFWQHVFFTYFPTSDFDQTWSKWPVPWPLLTHKRWWGLGSLCGHWGQKMHFHQKGIKSFRIRSIDAWLMHMH